MGRIVKITLSIIAVIIIIIIALPFFINPNDFKPEIQAAVKENIGRDLIIDGDLELSVFPWIGISTGKLTLSNAVGFSDRPFAEIQESDVKVKLLPLFSKKVEVNRIVLKGLNLNLAKNKQGKTNWEDLSKVKNEQNKPKKEQNNDTNKSSLPIAALAIGGVSIEQAHIVWDDQQQGKHIEINDFNFNTDELIFDEPIEIDLSLNIISKEPKLKESIQFSTELVINEQLNVFTLNKTKISSETLSKLIPGEKLIATLLVDIGINLSKQSLTIDGLKLNAGNLTLTADIKANNFTDAPILNGSLNIDTPDITQFMQGIAIPLPETEGNKKLKKLSVSFNFNTLADSADIDNLIVKLNDINLNGSASIKNFNKPVIKSDINVTTFNLAKLLKSLAIPLSELQDPTIFSQLAFGFSLQTTADTAEIQNLIVKLDDINLTGSAHVENFTNPVIKTDIKIESFNLARILKGLSIILPDMQDSTALNKLSMAFKLLATTDSAEFQNLVIKLDDTNINGTASIKNFGKPAIGFDIKVDTIDANRYLSPETAEQASKEVTPPSAVAVAGANLFPVETMRKLNVNGRLAIGQLKINQLKMKGLDLKLNANKGDIKTKQSIRQLYQGSYSGNSAINVQNKTPVIALNEKLSGVQVEQLLTDMKVETKITGKMTAKTKINGRGNTVAAIKSSLSGNIDFSFKDSVVRGFNLQKIIDNSRTLIEGRALQTDHKKDQTVFSVISGSATIKNGLVSNNDLVAESSKVRVKGKGTANLKSEALDYKVNARLLKRAATETKAEKIRGVPIVINIGGTFSEPSYQIDAVAMVKEKYRAKIDKKLDKEKDKILEKLDKKLGPEVSEKLKPLIDNILKGLF